MPLHLTGTRVAEYFRFACERQLHHGMEATHPLVAPGGAIRPGAGLLASAGREWERKKVTGLLRRLGPDRVLTMGWKGESAERIPAARVIELLRDPRRVEVLVQPELRLRDPARFARRFGLDPAEIEFGAAVPDLIRIRTLPDGSRRFQVVDIKASAEARSSHYAQVAFYTLVLDAVCAEAGIEGGRADRRHGRIWARDGRGPTRFPLAAYRHHVREILRRDVARVASRSLTACEWHVSARCAGCPLLGHCRSEADGSDDLARIPGITPIARRVLRERGIESVAKLVNTMKKDTYTGCHALESQSERLRQRAQAVRFGKVFDVDARTHLMPQYEDARLVLTAESDPVTGRCFALGMRLEAASRLEGAPRLGVWIAGSGTEAGERAILDGFLTAIQKVMDALSPADGTRRGLSLHLYLYDRVEMEALRALLLRHLLGGQARPEIARLLGVVSPRSAGGQSDPARSQPGTIVADVVAALFALPVPYAYDLAAVSERLRPDDRPWSYQPRAGYGWPFSSQVAFERIHNVWRGLPYGDGEEAESPEAVREEIGRTVASKLAAIDSVIRAVRERSVRRQRLQMRKEPFAPPAADGALAHPVLETLRVFTELEAAAERVAIDALHLLSAEDRARRFECIRGLELAERRDDGTLAFTFDPACRDAKFRVGDFSLILTNDDDRTLLETDRQPWKRRRLMVELVGYDLSVEPPRVVLAPTGGMAKAEAEGWIDLDRRCVLDRVGSDFNTTRILASLRALDEGRGEAGAILGLVEGREPPCDPPLHAGIEAARALLAESSRRLGRPLLNSDQERAWSAALVRPVSVVWGPPGTGKTYLLAWTVIGMAAAAAAEGRAFRMLVGATTHRAIINVLGRIGTELRGAGLALPLRMVKLRGSGSEADAELEGTGVELVPDTRLPSLLAAAEEQGESLVVGATVWSLWKQMRAAGGEADDAPVRPWFDAVVIDEASQMKVAESLIAMSSMRPGAQLILCGDDRQLAPIVRGRYDADAGSLVGSVFAHMAARFPRLALRESRRMNRALVAYPRGLFYPGLVSMVPERRIVLADEPVSADDALLRELFLAPDDAVVLCTYDSVRATARNDFEAHLAARIARLARDGLRDPSTGDRYTDRAFAGEAMAILSPHRAQNSAILGHLRGLGLRPAELPVVDTVERMQGNERDLVIVSYAVADREYAEAEASFLLDPNRFNVSITRARAKVIVLLSQAVLDALPGDERVLEGSMALKGYPDHCRDRSIEAELPAPGGGVVRVRCRYRSLLAPRAATALDTPLAVG